jgi:hypothetical protein
VRAEKLKKTADQAAYQFQDTVITLAMDRLGKTHRAYVVLNGQRSEFVVNKKRFPYPEKAAELDYYREHLIFLGFTKAKVLAPVASEVYPLYL